MNSSNSREIIISGASGWLGKEVISLFDAKKIAGFITSDLQLFSSNGRSIKLANKLEFLTSAFEIEQHKEKQSSKHGFIHLAFLTRDKLKALNLNDYLRVNLELISKACQIIEIYKPKWVVLVSSGAIFDRESDQLENNMKKNPYGFCKRLEELLLMDAARSVGANIVIGRLWGASGGQMPPNEAYALSDFIESARLQNKIQIRSGGEVFRRYVDAGEFMEVLIRLAISGESHTIDSGGDIVEIGELSHLVAEHFPGTLVNRSKIPIETDDYYPKTGEFNELAKDLGVGLSAIKEQVARTVKGHIQQTIN